MGKFKVRPYLALACITVGAADDGLLLKLYKPD